jgi:predicted ATP-dependent Lon-type protease
LKDLGVNGRPTGNVFKEISHMRIGIYSFNSELHAGSGKHSNETCGSTNEEKCHCQV